MSGNTIMEKLEQHPLSAAFPAMAAEQFQELKDSIERIGVQNPVTLFEGRVIDGWHRYRAATELGMECPAVELGPATDPRDFVLAQNKARRHVTAAQMALAAAAVHQWLPNGSNQHGAAPKGGCAGPALPQSGHVQGGCAGPALPQSGHVQGGCAGPALPEPAQKSAEEIAKSAGVSRRSMFQAKQVQANAVPEVVNAVQRGELGLEKAVKIARLPKEQQAEAIHAPIPKRDAEPPVAPADVTDADLPDEGPSLQEIVDELMEENRRLQADVEALQADDAKAEIIKWRRMYEHARRLQDEAMATTASNQREAKRLGKMVRSCCEALGLSDPIHLVAAVRKLAARREAA